MSDYLEQNGDDASWRGPPLILCSGPGQTIDSPMYSPLPSVPQYLCKCLMHSCTGTELSFNEGCHVTFARSHMSPIADECGRAARSWDGINI